MPTGMASIIGDLGQIATDPPTPVSFVRSSYPNVWDGEEVYFERRSDDPRKASTVRAATGVDDLVGQFVPAEGLTSDAASLLFAHAVKTMEPLDGEDPDEAMARARGHMALLADRIADGSGRVGVGGVRAGIAALRRAQP